MDLACFSKIIAAEPKHKLNLQCLSDKLSIF